MALNVLRVVVGIANQSTSEGDDRLDGISVITVITSGRWVEGGQQSSRRSQPMMNTPPVSLGPSPPGGREAPAGSYAHFYINEFFSGIAFFPPEAG